MTHCSDISNACCARTKVITVQRWFNHLASRVTVYFLKDGFGLVPQNDFAFLLIHYRGEYILGRLNIE
jgi:hypothetical protein